MPEPTLLDDFDNFDMSKPFLDSERLDALAYHMSLSPSLSETCVDPQCFSANQSTTEYVEHDDQCTAKPLHGPPHDFIHELLQVTVDFRKDSPLWLAMIQKDPGRYINFRSRLTARTMPFSPVARHTKNDFPRIVDGSLHTLIPLAAALLLQLWIHDGASNDTHAFHAARDTLMRFGWSAPTCVSANHAVFGPMVDSVPLVFAMVERMSHPFMDYEHHPFASASQDRPPFDDFPTIIEEGPQSDHIPSLCKCRVDTRHIMAQMKVQSMKAISGLSLFTALLAFNVVALVQDEQLYVTRNLTPHLSKLQQRNPQASRHYLELVLVFITAAIARAYPEAVPPGRREHYSQLFIPAARPNTSISLFVSNVIGQGISLTRACRNIAFRLCPKMILIVNKFSVSFGGDSFKRIDGGGYFEIKKLPFNLLQDRDGRRTAVSPSTGLVLKMFANDQDFTDERNIYARLCRYNIQHIPYILGTFRNDCMQVNALLISYEGHPLPDEGTISEMDWQHLVTIIRHLHSVGVHHHDLKWSNIIRSTDGALVVIDFGLSDLDAVCETKYCEDWAWLESVHPSGKVPDWFPPPPITPVPRHQCLSPEALFGICCTIIPGFLLLFLLEHVRY